MPITDKEIEEMLRAQKLLSEKKLKTLLAQAKAHNTSLDQLLFEREVLPDEQLGQIMAQLYKVEFVRLADQTISEALLSIVPYTLASKQLIIPFEKTKKELKVAISDPHNYELLTFLEKKTGLTVVPYYGTPKDIKAALKVYNRDVNEKFTKLLKGAMKDLTKIESLQDAAKILDTIILFAYQNDASDIHIEPRKQFLVVRYRMDGILHTIAELPMEIADLLVTRIKVLANLRTDEHRAPQDGRVKIDLENNEITLRVSILPTYYGEKSVLRLLSSSNQELDLESLGYEGRNLAVILDNIAKTHGIILMTGPTGSGKTTTLYSILKVLNTPEVNLSTIEDPIEYSLEGINQIQVNKKTDLTFANGLRSLLRQDPDIVMVGEIRDEETASVAINAALTGHLVLATLHTNDAASTLPRMLEMGVESFLLAATAQVVVAQRLIRKICEKCKVPYEVNAEQLKALADKFNLSENLDDIFADLKGQTDAHVTLYKGEGCTVCNSSGYKGRKSIAEVMDVSDNIRQLILDNKNPTELEAKAKEEGMRPLFIDGMDKVLKGVTTIEEVLRVMKA